MGRRTLVVAQFALLASSLAVVVATTRASDWQPVELVALLAIISVLSDQMAIETKALRKLRLPSQHRKMKTYIGGQ